jgi:ribosome-associated heat shock protein Hsp15
LSVDNAADGQRIDQWLWHARRFPSRSAATHFVESGVVRVFRDGVGRRIEKASFRVRPQDEIAYAQNDRIIALRVLGCASRRVPAREVASLYSLLDAGQPD